MGGPIKNKHAWFTLKMDGRKHCLSNAEIHRLLLESDDSLSDLDSDDDSEFISSCSNTVVLENDNIDDSQKIVQQGPRPQSPFAWSRDEIGTLIGNI